ncbi:lipid-phosphate phosphatase-like protein [Microdochium nivale]|nr:lipid-phosphate phosphatase-like protein [Microdochium nivale]
MRTSTSLAAAVVMAEGAAQAVDTKTFATSDGTRYTYDVQAAVTVDDGATNTTKPIFLFFHGYPSTRHGWAAQAEALTAAGYGVVIPDLLGFGDSDKPDPVNLSLYTWRRQSGHFCGLLDWGTSALGRAYNYNSNRFRRLVFISVVYLLPQGWIKVDAFNAQVPAATGG